MIKNKNTNIKNKNMKCAKQTWKCIFIMLIYANIDMRYDLKFCLKLMLNKLNEMKGFTFIYTFLKT
jgi:hypothetical protein